MTEELPTEGRPDGTEAPADPESPSAGADDGRAAIVVVSRDAIARQTLSGELSGRYGADYRIVVCGEPAELDVRIQGLRGGRHAGRASHRRGW